MLLDRVQEVFTDPFPHVIIENALPDDFYQALVATRPHAKEIIGGRSVRPNQRIDMSTGDALRLPSPWGEFISAHVSPRFYKKAEGVFGELPKVYSLRCQPGLNTPCTVMSKVRGPHLDNPSEIYAGLLYFGGDGDLEVYRWKGPKKFWGKLEVQDECVELVKTVPNKPNTYFMFLNGPDALHGVTARQSRDVRYLVNVIADTDRPLFKVGHGPY